MSDRKESLIGKGEKLVNDIEEWKREDWEEVCCKGNSVERRQREGQQKMGSSKISSRERIEKLDDLLNQDRKEEAGVYLMNWYEEAAAQEDWGSQITVLNEMMGYYRNMQKEELGIWSVREGIALLEAHRMGMTETGGTTYVNGATTMKAFGRAKEAMPYYEKAFRAYGKCLDPSDYRFAGLYHNMALTLADLAEFEKAQEYYQKALQIMKKLPEGGMEMAVTYVNLACLYEMWEVFEETSKENTEHADGADENHLDVYQEKIEECMELAMQYLNDPQAKRNGYYAFTCRKCAATFGHFGYFQMKRELEQRADTIYKRNYDKV